VAAPGGVEFEEPECVGAVGCDSRVEGFSGEGDYGGVGCAYWGGGGE